MNTRIEITTRTILITVAVLAGAWILFQVRDILYLLFIAFLLMTALHPLVVRLERLHIPRLVALIIIYAVIFGLFGLTLAGSIPTIIVQSTRLAQVLPDVLMKVLPYWKTDLSTISQQIAPIGENLIKVTIDIFNNIVTTLAVLMFTFYFLLERRRARKILTDMFGEEVAFQTVDIVRAIEIRIGEWVRGELILMLAIGIMSYIGLLLLHIDFALPLALVAGILEIVPNIGPIVSAIPAVLIGFSVSPILALSVVALYIIVQQFENHIIVPVVMKQSVGLSPLITIVALMVGGKMAGIMGAILAVPVLLVCQVLILKLIIEPANKNSLKRTKNPLLK
jgi:predicted PurR-regulated permease PerM